MNKILRRVFAWYYFIIFGGLLILLYPLFYITLSDERWYPYANKLRWVWAFFLMPFTGMNYRVQYTGERFDKDQQYIFCSNHTSILDIPFFGLFAGDRFRFMAKKEFGDIPIFGMFFRTVDIAVNRQSKIGSFKAFIQAAESIDRGYSMVIFPEGTTAANPPELLEFKNGPFKLAIDKQVPIVPITFLDNWHLFNYDKEMQCAPGTARVIVHPPIETAGMTDEQVELLKNEVFAIIDSDLKQEYGSKQPVG